MSYKSFTFKQLKEQFGLQQSIISIFPTADIIPFDADVYYLDRVPIILGVLQIIVDSYQNKIYQ